MQKRKLLPVLILFFICFYINSVVSKKPMRCGRTMYNLQHQGCCAGELFDRVKGTDTLACCTRAKKPYILNKQTCCGNQIQNNEDAQDKVCCENHFRLKNKGLCCKDKYYGDANRVRDGCCGERLNKDRNRMCCEGWLKNKIPNGKCCGTEVFNKNTHWCKKNLYILTFGQDLCYGKRYNKTTDLCCYKEKKTIAKNDSRDDQCCDSTSYFSKDYYCVDNKLVSQKEFDSRNIPIPCGGSTIDGNERQCCGGLFPFDPINEKCCGGTVIDSSDKCCDGKQLDTAWYVCCKNEQKELQVKKPNLIHDSCCFLKNGSTETYNSISDRCSLYDGKVIPNKKRCGGEMLNDSTDICCGGVLTKNGKVKNMGCCGVKPYHRLNQSCDSFAIKNINSIEEMTKPGQKCGITPVNPKKDLCCSGIFVENGTTLGQKCCGIKPYFTQNQTCCFDTSIQETDPRFKINPCTCPSYCQRSWIGNLRHLKNFPKEKEWCGYKVYKIRKQLDKTWKFGKKNKIVRFKKDCTCTCGGRTTLYLMAKKVTKKGFIRGTFFLLPNRRKFRSVIKRARKKIKKCKSATPKRTQKSKGKKKKDRMKFHLNRNSDDRHKFHTE